jgi:N-methylhydantoinase A
MRRAVVPAFAAMFSALGMLMARPGRVFTRAIYLPFAEIKDTTLSSAIQSLIDEADSHADLANRGPRTDELAADVRYAGQSTTLEIPLSGDLREMRAQFERAHETRYGHKLMQEPELVRIRWRAEDRHPLPRSVASLQQPDLAASFQRLMASPPANLESLPAILSVKDLHPYQHIEGPRTLLAPGTTIRLDKDWIAMRDEAGHLLLMRDH